MTIETIDSWLQRASDELVREVFATPRLDAEIILAHTVNKPRTWLHAHGDHSLDARQIEIANARIDLRLDHVPVAYIVGHKEFYGRRFTVSPAVLIPRPESEQMIELLREHFAQQTITTEMMRLVDIGTGSGCLGITAKLLLPELDVTLLDTSKPALDIAAKNAEQLGADVVILESNLLATYPYAPHIALANLPYVDETWDVSRDAMHEPPEALYATQQGLTLIEKCFDELSRRMKPGGVAIFEADPRQWQSIDAIARTHHFTEVASRDYAKLFVKQP